MLLNANLEKAHLQLIRITISRFLPFDEGSLPISKDDVSKLVMAASILSLSDFGSDVAKSYDICSRLLEEYGKEYPDLIASTDLIFSRIGNFPGRTLLRSKFSCPHDQVVPFPLAIERIAREAENSVDESLILTDFQYKLYSALFNEKALSVSAPTSAGKSFVLNLDLVRRLQLEKRPFIIYVVPTRALVTEVVARVRKTLRSKLLINVAVRTAPFPVDDNAGYVGLVYVLTQERLLRLLSWATVMSPPTSLIIDEAHELEKGKRGILLQNAIEIAIAKFPSISVLFASPLIRNPGYLLGVFKLQQQGRYFVEETSPVAQNVLLVSPVTGKPQSVTIQQQIDGKLVELGTAKFNFKFRGSMAYQKANFASQICKIDESVVIFCDTPSDAEETALNLCLYVPDYNLTSELQSFIKFIELEIHPEHPLVECLNRGVGFHYGHMPSIIRAGIERFFKNGQLKFLCSTSTLLQGVNLPAKHIVILNPHLGDEGMGRADFRNLAGRAGRLLEEFHGNVWCLRPGQWDVQSYEGDSLHTIRGAMDSIMDDGGVLIGGVFDGLESGDSELADAAISRLYYQVRDSGAEVIFESYVNENNEDMLRDNLNRIANIKITVPIEILNLHRSLRPDHLQDLYNLILRHENLNNLVLINPHEPGGKGRMELALSLINQAFFVRMEDRYFNWVSTTAHKWVWGTSIGLLLHDRISYVRQKRPDATASPEIRKLLKLIETEIRYKLVKFFSAYEDLCRLAFSEKGLLEPTIAPYHVYLEFGSSEPGPLNLMALGLSRFTALRLAKIVPWTNERSSEEYLQIILKSVLVSKLPDPCKYEIREILSDLSN
jgi:hypothetical protein